MPTDSSDGPDVTVDRAQARARFAATLALAQESGPLPEQLIAATRAMGASPGQKTFIPMLGSALLMKATNRCVDAVSIKKSQWHRSASARGRLPRSPRTGLR